ncbi:MAG: NACHT domain-containing protein, partial [Pseudomonadota bacterium]
MTDPSAIAAAVKLIFPVGQAISKPFGPLTKAAYSNLQQALYNATQKYREKYCERHGELKVLGMSRPASLDDIYVKVRLLDRNSIRMFESLDKIEETFRTAKQRSFGQKDCVTKPGYEVANGEQYLMVLGGPGAGKSTFLRKMGMETLKFTQEEGFHHECVPVFVELKRFKELPIDIESHISDEFETCGFPKPKEFTQAALKQGKLLVLLDGLDEVPTANRSEAVKQIQDFVDRYSKNRFIASCRIAAYNQNFRRFTDVGVAEFDDEQIRDFIDNWFGKESNRSNDCWEEVTKADSVGVKELAQTPLLLTLVCLLFEKGGELPVRRATLYDRALRVLLEEWNASKELERDKPYKGLDTRAKELLLATIAFDFFEDDRLFFPRRELASTIETVLKEEILPDEKRVDGNVVLRTIEVQHGILAERSTDIYSFSHLTLQEFLAAVQISDNPSKYLKRAIKNHLFDERWKEVFLLL